MQLCVLTGHFWLIFLNCAGCKDKVHTFYILSLVNSSINSVCKKIWVDYTRNTLFYAAVRTEDLPYFCLLSNMRHDLHNIFWVFRAELAELTQRVPGSLVYWYKSLPQSMSPIVNNLMLMWLLTRYIFFYFFISKNDKFNLFNF